MDKLIDQAWISLLASAMKKRGVMRPEMGDEVDLYVPQTRLLSLAESNLDVPKLLYLAAYSAAQRNAHNIMSKLGMPADYFWKFEYWPKGRALTTLGQIVNKVFTSMMTQAKEGNLKIADLDIEPLRISISFENCVECAGISGLKQGMCYYHAGIFPGILSALINRELDSFETTCCATGDASCLFIIGDKTDEHIITGHAAYLSPPEIKTDLTSRLEKSLNNIQVRAIGNMVDINYLRLVMASVLLADRQVLASNKFEAGLQMGRKMAPLLAGFYKREGLQNINEYYSQSRQLCVEIKENATQVEMVVRECPEYIGETKIKEMTSFVCGELQGLTSELTGTELVLKESRSEADSLHLTFAPKV